MRVKRAKGVRQTTLQAIQVQQYDMISTESIA